MVDDKIFVIGGYSVVKRNTCEVFSVRDGKWLPEESVPAMPTARYCVGTAVIGRKIFVIGGTVGTAIKTVEVLDTTDNSWKELPSMPTARYGFGTAVIDNRFIWCFAGFPHSEFGFPTDVVEVFDARDEIWISPRTRVPSARGSVRAVVVGDEIWLIGGITFGASKITVEKFNPKKLTWERGWPCKSPHGWHSVICF